MSILEINNLELKVEDNTILDGLNAEIEEGIVTSLVGPNGTGKSSFSFVITGLNEYKDFEGECFVA